MKPHKATVREMVSEQVRQGMDMHERPQHMAHEALHPKMMPSRPLDVTERTLVGEDAIRYGTLAAIAALTVSGSAVGLANRLSPLFRRGLGVSGKTALIVTPTAGAFYTGAYQTVGNVDAHKYLGKSEHAPAASPRRADPRSKLAPWEFAANAVYKAPFTTIIATAASAYGLIFWHESTNPATANMIFSQKLIHTRVYGQLVAVCTTVAVMGFVDRMAKAGGPYVVDEPPAAGAAAAGSSAGSAAAPAADADEDRGSLHLLVPLLYAPVVPLARIGLRGRVPQATIDRIVGGTIAAALTHAGYIMVSDGH
jgi:hypothetical protein